MNKILSKNSNLMKYLDEWLKEVHADLCLNYFMPKKNYSPTFSVFEKNNAIFIKVFFGIKENFCRDIL